MATGDEVVISPSLFCGDAPTHPGPGYEILGAPIDGTHAEFVVVPASNVAPKPGRLSWEQAAALPMAGMTAWRALVTRGRLSWGETVVLRTRGDLGSALADTAQGADVALDPSGALWQPLADALRPAGRLVVVGKAGAEVGVLRVQSLYWKQLDVLGTSMGSPADFTAYLDHVTTATWSPRVDSVYPLERVADA